MTLSIERINTGLRSENTTPSHEQLKEDIIAEVENLPHKEQFDGHGGKIKALGTGVLDFAIRAGEGPISQRAFEEDQRSPYFS